MAHLIRQRAPYEVQMGKSCSPKMTILNRWSEHFLHPLQCVPHSTTIRDLPHHTTASGTELDKTPSLQGMLKAIEQLKSGQAAVTDGIPPEM